MKRTLLFLLGLTVLVGSLSSCKKYKNKEVYANVPVYMDYGTFRNSFEFKQGTMMKNAGNVYVHGNYILINDIDRGIHIFDNSNPSDPYSIGFMNIPGNTQMAVKGDRLYANSFMDLLVIDISDIHNPKLIEREMEVFSYCLPMTNDGYPIADIDKSQGVVVAWNIEKTKEVSGFMAKFNVKDCADCNKEEVDTKAAVSARVDLAGSMSKFAIIGDYLYCLDRVDIKSFNIANPQNVVPGSTKRTWAEPETLFPHGDYLMVGTTTGMMIYNAAANREMPEHTSTYEHVESCDPVITDGNYAYVTLRSGSDCGGDVNQLQVVDISNMSNPSSVAQFDMTDPHGLSKDGNLLFLCDGNQGLKIFNSSNPSNVGNMMTYQYSDIQSKDIILTNGLAIMIAEEGIYEYHYTPSGSVTYLSMVKVIANGL